MRVLLTGAAGFIGSHFLRKLIADGQPTAVLVRGGSDTWRIQDMLPWTTVIWGDLGSASSVADSVATFAPDVIVHLAWAGVAGRHRNDLSQVQNISYEWSLLQLAELVGVKHWIGVGSQAEYGPCCKAISETTPTRPTTEYGVAKLCASLLAREMCESLGMRFVWFRLFSIYGPMDDPQWMIPYLVLKLLQRKRPSLTEAEQCWDYLYVSDVAEVLYRATVSTDVAGVFNLGSGEAHSLRPIIEHVRDMIDTELPLGFGEVPYRPDQVMHLQADIAKITSVTGWIPQVALDEGLRETIEWFRANSWRYEHG